MKKNNIISTLKAASAMLLLPLALTACQDEPEVGSKLYPVAEEAYLPVAYIDNHAYNPKNYKATVYAQAGTSPSLEIPNDTLTFKVMLTAAAPNDLTFTLKVDNSLAEGSTESYRLLGEADFAITSTIVTVKQGAMESAEPFRVALNPASKALMDLAESEKGLAVFTIASADDIKISSKYNAYRWELSKEVHWVNVNGTVDNLTKLPVADYDVLTNYGRPGKELSDGDLTTTASFRIGPSQGSFLRMTLHQPTPISAIQLTPAGEMWGFDLTGMFMKEIEILGSMDGTSYTRLGFATNTERPTTAQKPWNIVFYSAQTVKYIAIRTLSTFDSIREDDSVYLSEVNLFK